jgi:hypothetical protein
MALSAAVELSSAELGHPALWTVRVALRNDGPEPVRLSTATMLGPVSFEVLDPGGSPVRLGPPPTPPADLAAGLATIEPGGSLPLDYYGDELFPDAPPDGRYRLRFAAQAPAVGDAWEGRIESPWVEFDVTA